LSFQLVCVSCIESRYIDDIEQLTDHQSIDHYNPRLFYADDLSLVERASPRLGRAAPRFGRAAPRFGRAAPRFGRRAAGLLLSRLNHAGRYYVGDDDDVNNDNLDTDSWINEKRASPRLGRSV
jgi:hypothetical protein